MLQVTLKAGRFPKLDSGVRLLKTKSQIRRFNGTNLNGETLVGPDQWRFLNSQGPPDITRLASFGAAS
jgi:hypothetical protein